MATQLADIRRHFRTPTKSEHHFESLGKNHNTLSVSPTKRRTKVLGDVENGTLPKRSKYLRGARIDTFCKSTKFLRLEPFADTKERYAAPPVKADVTLLARPIHRSPIRHRTGIHTRYKAMTKSPTTRRATACLPDLSSRPAFPHTILSSSLQLSSQYTNDASPAVSYHASRHPNSWFFEIHEDTAEELATNLLEHETRFVNVDYHNTSPMATKDIRGKENIPPVNEIYENLVTHSNFTHPGEAIVTDLGVSKAPDKEFLKNCG